MAKMCDRIKLLRLENDLTQQDVADRLGVNHMTVSGWERGTRRPSFAYADALADLFDVNLEYLVGSSDVRGRYPRHTDQTVKVTPDERALLDAYRTASDEIRSAARAVLGIR